MVHVTHDHLELVVGLLTCNEQAENIIVEYRFGEGRIDRVSAFLDELLRLRVDVLFAANPYVTRLARKATGTIPIVAVDLETDPIQAGSVKSLAKPGGNLTGFFLDIPELSRLRGSAAATSSSPRPLVVAFDIAAPEASRESCGAIPVARDQHLLPVR